LKRSERDSNPNLVSCSEAGPVTDSVAATVQQV
jgi:hypothetical protein